MMQQLKVSSGIRWKMRLLGILKIPMIGFIRPRVLQLTDQESIIEVPLKRRTRNHLRSMYIGAMVVGAELAAGVFIFRWMEENRDKFTFVFSEMNSTFSKRAETDIRFICREGDKIFKAFNDSKTKGERVATLIETEAINTEGEIVARFQFTFSVKVKQ